MKKYFIGIGTGRCGTMSLAKLVNNCENCNVSQEYPPNELDGPNCKDKILPWAFNKQKAQLKLKDLLWLNGQLVGDVAFYYLNYIDFFISKLPNLKVINIYRNKDEVCESYMNKTTYSNHWSGQGNCAVWDKAYPKIDVENKYNAIGKYWEIYKQKTIDLIDKYPGRIVAVDVSYLNKFEMQECIFEFLEINTRDRLYQSVHENKL